MSRALDREDWLTAAHLASEAHEIDAGSGSRAFIAACAYARASKDESAIDWLGKAADAGYSNARRLERELCFDAMRNDTEFIAVREEIWRHRDDRFSRFVELAQNADPLVYVPDTLDANEPAPLLVVLHGRGGRGLDIGRAWRLAADRAGLVLCAPNSLHLLGTGYQWTYLDESEYVIDNAIKSASAQHDIDESRIILSGFSQGASVALQLALDDPDRFPGAIAWAGSWDDSMLPLDSAAGQSFPSIYLLVGSRDRFATDARQAYKALRKEGARCHLRELAGLGHTFPRDPTPVQLRALRFALKNRE